jgi:hypothetical protein
MVIYMLLFYFYSVQLGANDIIAIQLTHILTELNQLSSQKLSSESPIHSIALSGVKIT